MGLRGLINNMIGGGRRPIAYSRDDHGNHWNVISSLRRSLTGKTFFDMNDIWDKTEAFQICTPLKMVIERTGSLLSNGRFYLMDKEGNDIEGGEAEQLKTLLDHPNPINTGSQFLKEIEINLKLYGYCPLYVLRASRKSIPKCLYIIPPQYFTVKSNGKLFEQTKLSDIISEAYITWGGKKKELTEDEYYIIIDKNIITSGFTNDIGFESVSSSLTYAVSNWVSSMMASHSLIVRGGPVGIISGDDKSEYGNTAMTSEEADNMNLEFSKKFGLVNKDFNIAVIKHSVKWTPLNFSPNDLNLQEEDIRCTKQIVSAIGLSYDSLIGGSTFSNQESSERKSYHDVIIPDSENIGKALTDLLCPEGVKITLDYSHIPALQVSRKEEGEALNRYATGIIALFDSNLITVEEARIELAKVLEINPEEIPNIEENDNSNNVGNSNTSTVIDEENIEDENNQ